MRNPASPHRQATRFPGFSLLEVLVTMGIGSALLVVAVSMLSQAGTGYDRGSGSVAAEREARAVLSQMGNDLANAVWHRDSRMENNGSGWISGDLGVLSLQAADAQSESGRSGDLCAVHYYLADIEVGTATVRCLMRGFRESGEVFPAMATGALDTLFKKETADEPVAFGVLSFEARPLTRNPTNGKWDAWNLTGASDPVTGTTSPPDALRLRLVVARRELLGKLSTTSDWDSSPLRGEPGKAVNNPDLETYEVIQRFGSHD